MIDKSLPPYLGKVVRVRLSPLNDLVMMSSPENSIRLRQSIGGRKHGCKEIRLEKIIHM